MPLPTPTDYRHAIQDPRSALDDEELRQGEVSRDARGLPKLWSGNFASVYRIDCPATGKSWALKCFTREVSARQDRYRHIAAALEAARLPFTVPFVYLERGIQVRDQWYPAVKMEWVEGQTLNRFVEDSLEKPQILRQLLDLWPKLAARLREAEIAHADLQHGNVLLVPAADGKLALKLIDYDGMYVPALAETPSGEAGHPNYQHPARLGEGLYSVHVDRFSHLVIYSAVHCLAAGNRDLWQRFNNDENLLFRERDFQHPGQSELFQGLWETNDPSLRGLVGRLALACKQPLEEVLSVDQVIQDGQVKTLLPAEQQAVESLMDAPSLATRPQIPASGTATAEDDFSISPTADQPTPSNTRPTRIEGTVAATLPPGGRLRLAGKSLWGGLAAVVRGLDRFLGCLVGPENRLLRYFLWAAVPLLLLAAVWAGIWAGIRTSTPSRAPEKPPPSAAQVVAARSDLKPQIVIDLGGGEKLEMVLVPAGEFLMGSPDADDNAEADEKPQHQVRITQPFYLGKYKVTQAQWQAVMGANPSRFKGPKNPVQNVSWDDCGQFLGKLNAKIQHAHASPLQAGEGALRLPTEAQWEYACRAGSTTRYCFGDHESGLPEYAWYAAKSADKTHAVGVKKPNAWGLYDMHGDVEEWCADWYDGSYYAKSPTDDPTGPTTGTERVGRGGGWDSPADRCRSAARGAHKPGGHVGGLGFRVAQVPADAAVGSEVATPSAPLMPKPAAAKTGTEVAPPSAPSKLKPMEAEAVESAKLWKDIAFDLGNEVILELVLIPAGEFLMGSPAADDNVEADEKPQHRVRITRPFYLGKYLVTQEQWQAVMGKNPSHFQGPKNPVEMVGWDDCQQFLDKLNGQIGGPGRKFVLPTEAQWEYACRAGSTAKFSFGDDESMFGEYAWYEKNADGQTHPVGGKKPNAWGLYDMHGNVCEWCQDWYDSGYYAKSPVDDPRGPDIGQYRVDRGGSWLRPASGCRSAIRMRVTANRFDGLGLRVSLVPVDTAAGTDVAPPSAPLKPNPVEAKTSEAGKPATPVAHPDTGQGEPPHWFGPDPPRGAKTRAKLPASAKPKEIACDLGDGVKLEMVLIPAGQFLMGSPESDANASNDEKPQHRVWIHGSFYLGKYLLTQQQWQAVMGSNPSHFKGPKNPVEMVSWDDCQVFLGKLNARFGQPRSSFLPGGDGEFRLPTEAQWEYACRAGSTTRYCFGDGESGLGEYSWYAANADSRTHPVGEKRPNPWGLYDVHGNVCEWCQDVYDDGYYAQSPTDDPLGPATGSLRVSRGGDWSGAGSGRSAVRFDASPGYRGSTLGLRVALVPTDK